MTAYLTKPGQNQAVKWVREEELIRLLLSGFILKECAQHMGLNYHTIRRYAKSPSLLTRLREHSGEIAERLVAELANNQIDMAKKLEEASEAALEEMMTMMGEIQGPNLLKVKIAQDLLDRDPRSSRTKRLDVTGTMSHDFISPAVLIHAAATAKEIEGFQKKQVGGGNGDGGGNPVGPADSGNG